MTTEEIKNTENEIMFNIIKPENDIENKVLRLLIQYAFSFEKTRNPDLKDFDGNIVLDWKDNNIRIYFLSKNNIENSNSKNKDIFHHPV